MKKLSRSLFIRALVVLFITVLAACGSAPDEAVSSEQDALRISSQPSLSSRAAIEFDNGADSPECDWYEEGCTENEIDCGSAECPDGTTVDCGTMYCCNGSGCSCSCTDGAAANAL